ncbi:2OG-Fe dioxygenase family protein [Streptomyces sp. NPDC060235]|uniref:2OG-Fe dioxygenase family protein n=1 Tax=Streptomyces sp. NPDC060235 TaxID=3347080 RepID=UPI00365BB624
MDNSGISEIVAEIEKIKSQYVADKSVFVEGARMVALLTGLGASTEDFERIKLVSDHLPDDPTLPFRRSRNGRFCCDPRRREIFRLEFQPFLLSAEEDFVRHDSGSVREFAEIGNDLQMNTVLQALLVFQHLMLDGVDSVRRPHLNYDTDQWITTLFSLRTVSTELQVGEPAMEGVHSDGVDHTMTTFLCAENMTDDSAVTFLHDMRETNGTRWHDADPDLVLGQCQHRHFMDTLLVIDHERKHSLSPVQIDSPSQSATRDMLIFFTRKPTVEEHPSHVFDSLQPHLTLPMSLPFGHMAAL